MIDEKGPAHQRTFTVRLELGDEVYEATGNSIKSAQHAAADEAMDKTKYQKPVLRQTRSINQRQTRNGKGNKKNYPLFFYFIRKKIISFVSIIWKIFV